MNWYPVWHRHIKILALAIATIVLALNLSPKPADAISWLDLLRAAPAVIQTVQLSNISDQQEVALGKQVDSEIATQVRISRDPAANELVNRIGRELVPLSDRPNIPYTFRVVEDKDLNAFATMGGFVYINTGTIAASDNRAQLASVIGHEMGHISGRHAIEQIRQMSLVQGLATVAGLDQNDFVQLGVQVALRLPNSREAEFDADRRGLATISRAGYAPQAMPAFMQKLAKAGGGGIMPAFLSTHPATQERIVALNDQIRAKNYQGDGGMNDTNYQRQWRNRFR